MSRDSTSQTAKTLQATLLAIIIILAATSPLHSPVQPAMAPQSYQPHAPIIIVGDQNFTTANGVSSGSGTPSDPYIIEGWNINATSQDGITIRNTRAHFTIRNVFIHSAAENGTVLDRVSNGRLESSTYHNNNWGIRSVSTTNIIITGNNFTANEIGMFLSASRIIIRSNSFSMNVEGLRLGAVFTGLVAENQFVQNSHFGLNLDYSHNITVNRNTFTGNGISIYGNILLYQNTHTITPDNLVNGRPILYYKDCTNIDIDGLELGQLIFVNCNNIRAANLNINYTDIGLQLINVQDALIVNNQIHQTMRNGIRLQSSTNITISNSLFAKNRDYGLNLFSENNNITVTHNFITQNSFGGLFLFDSQDITLTHNTISYNTWYGANLFRSTGIRTHHNNFLNNRYQVADDKGSENLWNDSREGNYWSDYGGSDSDENGIGDTPYIIDPNSRDNYPFMQPVVVHDIAVSDLVASPPSVFQGQLVSIMVSVSNIGEASENLTVTIYYDSTVIAFSTVQNLPPGSPQTLDFSWNTTGVTPGSYSITAVAGPVPGETKTHDNTFTDGKVTISAVKYPPNQPRPEAPPTTNSPTFWHRYWYVLVGMAVAATGLFLTSLGKRHQTSLQKK